MGFYDGKRNRLRYLGFHADNLFCMETVKEHIHMLNLLLETKGVPPEPMMKLDTIRITM